MTLYAARPRGAARSAPARRVARTPAIALVTVLGAKAPAKVTINEMTTVASVWTHNQFLADAVIRGHALGLKIAAGNVPNFVDLGDRRLGRCDPGSAQQRPDPDDG